MTETVILRWCRRRRKYNLAHEVSHNNVRNECMPITRCYDDRMLSRGYVHSCLPPTWNPNPTLRIEHQAGGTSMDHAQSSFNKYWYIMQTNSSPGCASL